jgi:hypothetical protein
VGGFDTERTHLFVPFDPSPNPSEIGREGGDYRRGETLERWCWASTGMASLGFASREHGEGEMDVDMEIRIVMSSLNG